MGPSQQPSTLRSTWIREAAKPGLTCGVSRLQEVGGLSLLPTRMRPTPTLRGAIESVGMYARKLISRGGEAGHAVSFAETPRCRLASNLSSFQICDV